MARKSEPVNLLAAPPKHLVPEAKGWENQRKGMAEAGLTTAEYAFEETIG